MSLRAFVSAAGEDQRYLEKLGITSNLVRLSIGLEECNDLIRDLDCALNLSQTTD